MKKTINKNTNSYYTEKEYNELVNIMNFSWSNKSNNSEEGYENCIYKYENGISYDIEVTSKGFDLSKRIPTLFDTIDYDLFNLTYEELKLNLKTKTIDSLKLNLLKINSSIIIVLFLLIFVIATLFLKNNDRKKTKFEIIENKIKGIKKQSYFVLKDVLPFTWGFNLFVTGILISYFVFAR